MSDLYNPNLIPDFLRADADDLNDEFIKIAAAVSQLQTQINALTVGAGLPSFVWVAYADSADGTVNFSLSPGSRSYLGLAFQKATPAASNFPVDYAWSQIRGASAAAVRLVASAQRFKFNSDGVSTGVAEVLITAEGKNLSTAIDFTAENDSGAAVTLTADSVTSKKLTAAAFGNADWVRVDAVANGGEVTDSITLTAQREAASTLGYRGTYDAAATYAMDEIVRYSGSSLISLVDANIAHTPDPDNDTAYWAVLAKRGAAGTPASPPGAFVQTINLVSASTMVNLRDVAAAAGYAGQSNATITFNVPNGVIITGLKPSGIAIDSGDWPSGFACALTLVVQSGGVVRGGGGNGGAGGATASGGPGLKGGDAINCRLDMTVTVQAGGTVQGGGAGGKGGDAGVNKVGVLFTYAKGGGGGGGFPNGLGGASGGSPATAGSNGTLSGGGAAGSPGGVAGAGAAGATTSAAGGYAIRKNGKTITYTNAGTVTGTVGG